MRRLQRGLMVDQVAVARMREGALAALAFHHVLRGPVVREGFTAGQQRVDQAAGGRVSFRWRIESARNSATSRRARVSQSTIICARDRRSATAIRASASADETCWPCSIQVYQVGLTAQIWANLLVAQARRQAESLGREALAMGANEIAERAHQGGVKQWRSGASARRHRRDGWC